MTAVVERWWFTFLLLFCLVLLYIVGGIALVSFALAHIACDGCTAQPRDIALTLYFVAGLGILILTTTVTAATSTRIPARRVLIPGLGLLFITLATCFAILLRSVPG